MLASELSASGMFSLRSRRIMSGRVGGLSTTLMICVMPWVMSFSGFVAV